jgi:hypothetical protein
MKAGNWIDKVKASKGLPSDYAVAKILGLSRFTVSGYRQRPDATLDEDIAIKVANVLGERPEAVVLDQVAERAKDPAIRAALLGISSTLCILCQQAIATVFVAPRAV